MEDQENDFIKNIVMHGGKQGKVVDDDSSEEDEKISPTQLASEGEPGRALTRTRNSMDL
jgi:hypothetical protein